MAGKECRQKKKPSQVMEELYLTTEENPYLWEEKVLDPLDKSIDKQKIKKEKPARSQVLKPSWIIFFKIYSKHYCLLFKGRIISTSEISSNFLET